MPVQTDLSTVSVTLEEIAVRETDEEQTAWQVTHPELDRPCRGDSPRAALDIFGECVETDDEEIGIDLTELSE